MNRPSIVEVIGHRVPLHKIGREYRGLCPFHEEKTPSFSVNEDKGVFHCFGCHESGDVIDFIRKLDGVSFFEAKKSLGIDGSLPRPLAPRAEALNIARWANEQTARADSLLREIGLRLELAKSARWSDEIPFLERKWSVLEDLAEDLQTVKLIIELYENRVAIEQLLAEGEPADDLPVFPKLTPEYRALIDAYVRGKA